MLKFNLQVVTVSLVLLVVNSAALAAKPNKLAQVFNADTIDADLSYLEYMTGPARNTSDSVIRGNEIIKIGDGYIEKVYRVDGCEVTASIERGVVRSLGLTLSPTCTFKLNAFLVKRPELTTSVHKMTFGQIASALGNYGSFTASCFESCGTTDPSIYDLITLANNEGYYQIMMEDIGSEQDIRWADAIIKAKGHEWASNRENAHCSGKYSDVASRLFKAAKITKITIGKDIGVVGPFSSECR